MIVVNLNSMLSIFAVLLLICGLLGCMLRSETAEVIQEAADPKPGLNHTEFTPVSARTPQVRDAIVAAVPGVNNADDVTTEHLAAITSLDLADQSISSLKAGDFKGLTSLTFLYLSFNSISDISPLENLAALRKLELRDNPISDYGPLRRLKQTEDRSHI